MELLAKDAAVLKARASCLYLFRIASVNQMHRFAPGMVDHVLRHLRLAMFVFISLKKYGTGSKWEASKLRIEWMDQSCGTDPSLGLTFAICISRFSVRGIHP